MNTYLVSMVTVLVLFSGLSKAETIRLGISNDPPITEQIIDEQANKVVISGIAVELVNAVFDRMAQPIKLEIYPWARALDSAKKGMIDGIFTIYRNKEREAYFDYSREVLIQQEISFFVLNDSAIQWQGDLTSLSQYQIGGILKFSYGDAFDAAVSNRTLPYYTTRYDNQQLMKKLLRSNLDVIIVNSKLASYHGFKQLKALDKIRALHPAVDSIPSYIAFSKKSKLTAIRDQFDQVIAKMKKEGSYQKIIDNYF